MSYFSIELYTVQYNWSLASRILARILDNSQDLGRKFFYFARLLQDKFTATANDVKVLRKNLLFHQADLVEF